MSLCQHCFSFPQGEQEGHILAKCLFQEMGLQRACIHSITRAIDRLLNLSKISHLINERTRIPICVPLTWILILCLCVFPTFVLMRSLLVRVLSILKVKALVVQSCQTLQPHGLQTTRLLCPWNSPGKNTEVSCHLGPLKNDCDLNYFGLQHLHHLVCKYQSQNTSMVINGIC